MLLLDISGKGGYSIYRHRWLGVWASSTGYYLRWLSVALLWEFYSWLSELFGKRIIASLSLKPSTSRKGEVPL